MSLRAPHSAERVQSRAGPAGDRADLPDFVRTDDSPGFTAWKPSVGFRLLILASVLAAASYVSWWLTPGHVGTPVLFFLLGGAEAFTLVHLLGVWWAMWGTSVAPPPEPVTSFSVDVFVPTRGEPLEILQRTIGAAVGMEVPHQTFVLDDAARPEVEALARALGAGYLSRKGGAGNKAGNLNHALSETSGDLFALFDADHVPHKEFLSRVVGYFEDPTVAFVQTPQFYGNSLDEEVARGAYQQQAIFYGPLCRGKNGLGAAFCCGTNALMRRAAVQDAGGFEERSVVEDFVTSMRIHRLGWRSVYYPYILAEGLGPRSLRSYFQQQFRWARGSIDALVSLEPFKPGFTLSQRIQYLLATTFYLIGLVTLVYVLLPILYLLGGWSAFSSRSGSFLFFYGPYLLLGLLTIRAGLRGRLRLEHLAYTFGSFPAYALAGLAALMRIPARFRVTGKSSLGERARPPALAWVSVAAFFATFAAILAGAFLRPGGARTTTNMSWGVVNLLLLSGVVRAAFGEVLGRRVGDVRWLTQSPLGRSLVSSTEGGQEVLVSGNGNRAPAQFERLVLPEHAVSAPRSVLMPEPTPSPLPSLPRPPRRLTPNGRDVAILTALGLALRAALINVQSLRLDEATSLRQVQERSLSGLWHYLSSANVHLPLYHFVLHFWVRVAGTSEWAIRIPSVVLGAAAVPLVYLVARRLMVHRSSIIATAIGAASPFWVWHSDEARMYPLLLFLSLASMVLLFQAVERGRAWRWAAYAIVTGLSLYTHYFALLMLPVHLAYLLIHRAPRRKIGAWAISLLAPALMLAPWLAVVYAGRIQRSGLASLTNGVRIPLVGHSFFQVLYGLLIFCIVLLFGYHGPSMQTLLSGLAVGIWPVLALVVALSRGALAWFRTRTAAFLLSWLALTLGLVFAASYWRPGLLLHRYLIVASPALILVLALGLSRIPLRPVIGLTLVFVAFASMTVAENFEPSNPAHEDFRGAAALVERGFGPRDVVLLIPGFIAGPFDYYFPHDEAVVRLLSNGKPGYAIQYEIPKIATSHAGGTMWVVIHKLYRNTFPQSVFQAIPTYLDETFPRTATYDLGYIEVRSYRVPPG
jgi:Glycosyltransferase like family 2/Dolichyl-phosphate-mannose-protein mannosyltransferase